MEKLIEGITRFQNHSYYHRYDAVDYAIGYLSRKIENGAKDKYTIEEVIALSEAVAVDPDRKESEV